MRGRMLMWCVVGGLSLLSADRASAGTYDVFGCRLPDGKRISAEGWRPLPNGYGAWTSNSCADGGGLDGWLDPLADVGPQTTAGWIFEAPPDTTIENYTLYRSGTVARAPNEEYGRALWLFHDAAIYDGLPSSYAQDACAAIAACTGRGDPTHPLSPANAYGQSGRRILRLLYVARCEGPARCRAATSHLTVWASRIGVSDPHVPQFVRAPSGALMEPTGPIDGERSVVVAAKDLGGGISSVAIVVDGQTMHEEPAQSTATACVRPYLTPVPCPLSIERTLAFDTTRVSNGAHALQIMLTDAAGNRALSSPVTIEVRNRGVPNGVGASQFAKLEAWFASRSSVRRTASVVSYGKTRAIAGRLTDEHGVAIAGASLDVAATTGRPGSRARVVGQVVTDAGGAFSYTPPPGSSRRISVNYRAYTLDASASAISEVLMQTRAGMSFSVAPKRVSARGTIRFRGRLRGGPGREGTQVVIYALAGPRARIPVATVRADATGRFQYRYRFTNSAPGTTYRFRATLHTQRSYPYATGSSPAVTVGIR